jgi:hypothetical protein
MKIIKINLVLSLLNFPIWFIVLIIYAIINGSDSKLNNDFLTYTYLMFMYIIISFFIYGIATGIIKTVLKSMYAQIIKFINS